MMTVQSKGPRSRYAPFYDCPEPMRDFLSYLLTIRNLSPRTVDGYYLDLRTFFRFLKQYRSGRIDLESLQQVSIEDLTIQDIASVRLSDTYAFLNFCYESLGNQSNARARKVSALSSFYQYLNTKTTMLPDNPLKSLDRPATKKGLPRYLSLEESKKLLDSADLSQNPDHLRNYCILTLFLNCGMRLSELIGLNRTDVREEDRTLRLLGKGNKERIVYLNEACLDAIRRYQQDCDRPDRKIRRRDDALFISAKSGKRLSARRVEQIIGDCLREAGLDGKGYTPHKLRHTAATLMYQYGQVDVRILKEILGHANLGTTEIYTHVSNRQLEYAADHSPLSGLRSSSEEDKSGE